MKVQLINIENGVMNAKGQTSAEGEGGSKRERDGDKEDD